MTDAPHGLERDDPRLVFVPFEEATTPPPGLIEHFRDRWWSVDPERGVMFYDCKAMSPQCNRDEAIANALRARLYPWAETRFIPSVFKRINLRDYT